MIFFISIQLIKKDFVEKIVINLKVNKNNMYALN